MRQEVTLIRLLSPTWFQSREAVLVWLMTSYFFLAMASVSLIKSIQNGLYLSRVGVDWQLPLLYVALALVAGPVVFVYQRFSGAYSNIWLSSATFGLSACAVVILGFFIREGRFWSYTALYLFGGIFSVLVPAQGWLTSSSLYSSTHAKRVYAQFGMGGILGGAFGAYYAALLVKQGLEVLFTRLVIAIMLLQLILVVIYQGNRSRLLPRGSAVSLDGEPKQTRFGIRSLFRSRYLVYLSTIAFCTGFTSTLVDLQYKWALQEQYPGSGERITQFFGGLLGTVFVSSACIQLVATGRLLRRFGLGIGLAALPVGFLFGSVSLALLTGALSAFAVMVVLKTVDGTLRPSVDRTSVELLYIPVGNNGIAAARSFIDLLVFRFGDALAAVAFLLVSAVTPGGMLLWSAALVALTAVLWILVSRKATKEYSQILRRNLERPLLPGKPLIYLNEARAERALIEALKSPASKKVLFALRQLIASANSSDPDITAPAADELVTSHLFKKTSAKPRWLSTVKNLTGHREVKIGAAAMHLITLHDPGYLKMLRGVLNSPRLPESRYLFYVDQYVNEPAEFLDAAHFLSWCREASPDHQVALCRLMGKMRKPAFYPVLRSWADGDRSARTCAAIEAIGHYQPAELLDLLLERLQVPWSRRSARRALVLYGDAVVARLQAVLLDPKSELFLRREIPVVLTRIATESAKDALLLGLYNSDSVTSFYALRGLNQLRDESVLKTNPLTYYPILQLWARQYYQLLALKQLLAEDDPVWSLLKKTVNERLKQTLEKIFRGLQLFFPKGDAYISYLAYTGAQEGLQENAVDLMDVRIKGELRQSLLPIFSERKEEQLVRVGHELFGIPLEIETQFSAILLENDPWLKCCIITAAVSHRIESLREHISQISSDPDPLVRETAQWATKKWKEAAAPLNPYS